MWNSKPLSCLLLLCFVALAAAQRSPNRTTSRWQTLNGSPPLVVARGGFSGVFPDSSYNAYSLIFLTSSPKTVLWCDVQLMRDEAGICFPDLKLDNASNIPLVFPNQSRTYLVNGVSTHGWFSVDFNLTDLTNVSLNQRIYSRPDKFDNTLLQVLLVQDVATQFRPPGFWLNVQHDLFYRQHNLSMRRFIISVSRSVIVNYISSPEVNFLRSIMARFRPSPTKLIFRFLGQDEIEPSTNQTYHSLLRNLTFIRTFASGILVPKTYIIPMDATQYLLPATSVVVDAHNAGLEVFASDFANDVDLAYDYSYDPIAEYLSFIDNGNFSVDGFLSDFPMTPSAAIDCFAHIGRNASREARPLIISHEGASGDYPGCTDYAYNRAISDGVDVLDCPVQMTSDGIPICLGSINLMERTSVAQSPFSNRSTTVPELIPGSGIYTFDLTWSEIQSLNPVISTPFPEYHLFRNPRERNTGRLMSLSDFLALANNATSLSGILIGIENAAYLAEERGLGVTDAVLDALNRAGFDNQTAKKVMIQSTNSSVLVRFRGRSNYSLVYEVDENIRDAVNDTVLDITRFATSVVITKGSVFPSNEGYATGETNIVDKLKAFRLGVYVRLFTNEFVSQAWDFYSDPTVEINSFFLEAGVDGLVTEFPRTAARYRRNRCLNMNTIPPYMSPILPGSLVQLVPATDLPPAEAPNPILLESDVAESPLPPVAQRPPTPGGGGGAAAAPTPPNGQPKAALSILLSCLAILLATLVLF